MAINQMNNGNELTIAPVGRLDSVLSDAFSEAIAQGFPAENEKLVLDFSSVDFIISKGLRVLVSVYKALNGRKMEIVNANGSVLEVFRLSGLMPVFTVK